MGKADALDSVKAVYRGLLMDGYHRPNDYIELLETAMRELGMTESAVDRFHDESLDA